MDLKDRLNKVIQAEKQSVSELENILAAYDTDVVILENKELRDTLNKLKTENEVLNRTLRSTREENSRLRMSLNEQIINERLSILKMSRAKLETYFQQNVNATQNRLSTMETSLRRSLAEIHNKLFSDLMKEEELLKQELSILSQKVDTVLRDKMEIAAETRHQQITEVNTRYVNMANEPVSETVIQRRILQNNFERILGLSWMNKLGIFLIVLATVFLVKYGYNNWFRPGPYAKGIILLLLGLAFLASGEYFNRKDKNIFSLGLTSGGVAILYITAFSGYFYLHIFNFYTAIVMSLLITIATIIMSVRYDSKVICLFALIGGYLPFFVYVFYMELGGPEAMAYVFLLNAMVLVVSLFRKWQIVNWVGFLFSIPVIIYLVQIGNPQTSLFFTAAMFTLFLVITLGYSLRFKVPLLHQEVFLLFLNTTMSCALTYWLFARAGWNDYRGLLAVFFALLYSFLAYNLKRLLPKEEIMSNIFWLTALTFATLIVPFQFGKVWLSIGWTIEAVLFIAYGVYVKSPILQRIGWVVLGLAYYVFLFVRPDSDPLYHYKYAVITIGLFIALASHYMRTEGPGESVLGSLFNPVKYIILIHAILYALFEALYVFSHYLLPYLKLAPVFENFYSYILVAVIGTVYCWLLGRTKMTGDKYVSFGTWIIIGLIDLRCLILTTTSLFPTGKGDIFSLASWTAFLVLLAYHTFVFITLRRGTLAVIDRYRVSQEWYPIVMAAYLLLAVILTRSCQFGWIPSSHVVDSFVLMAFSFAFVVYGLKQGYSYIRRSGLILALFATAKLLLFDLRYMTSLTRIFAYFGFGLIFLAISYIYQRLEKLDPNRLPVLENHNDQKEVL